MGKLITEGFLPYKDFFYAHPPLQLFIYAFLIKLFGVKLWLMNIIPLISILVSSYIAYKITNKLYIMVLFLTFFPIFHLASVGFGMNLALMFIMLGFYFIEKKPMLASLFMGLAVFTRLIILPIVIGSLFYIKSKEIRSRYIVGLTVMAAIFLMMLILIPVAMNSLFFYHILKQKEYWLVMRYFLLGFGMVGTILAYKSRYFYPFIIYFIFLMSLEIVLVYYMIPLMALFVLALSLKNPKNTLIMIIISAVLGISLGAVILVDIDVYENKKEIKEIITTVKALDGELAVTQR